MTADIYTLDDASELEPIEEGEQELKPVELQLKFAACRDLDIIKNSLEYSNFASVILDEKLKILWENTSFRMIFGYGSSCLGLFLTNLLSSYFSESRIQDLFQTLYNAEQKFSWTGRIEVVHRDYLTIIANMVVLPVMRRENEKPTCYLAFFDDITEENRLLIRQTFLSLLEASKLKDNDTGMHIQRVGEYSRFIADQLFNNPNFPEVNREFVENISFLAPMHDVGKIGTPDDILNKEGLLEKWEWKIMKEHTLNGAYILSTYPNPMAKQIALFHHEKWNGSGYPYNLSEEMIPLSARIVAIADVYDALRMKRSYKRSFSHSETCSVIIRSAASHFDPTLVSVFTNLESVFNRTFEAMADD